MSDGQVYQVCQDEDIQHTAKLAGTNQADLNRLAAGLALGELGRETSHY